MKKSKKTAILTQPLGRNYGGIVQNFALQYVLKNFGYSVVTVSREYEKSISLKRILVIIKNETYNRILGIYRKIFSNKDINIVTKEMTSFINENIHISEKIYDTENLKKYFKKQEFDNVIIGSDQTWRPIYSPNIYNYYLDFLEDNNIINKIAYASSFGIEVWEYDTIETKKCRELIKKFNTVSVREDSGVTLCKENLHTEASLVLDPTLLLDGKDYINILNLDSTQNKGLYNYVLDKDSKKQDFIKSIASHLNIHIYNEQPNKALDDINYSNNLDDYIFPSPKKWLQGFLDANFIVTDSFHGTVFSILFNKNFIAIVNEERGATRFKSMLSKLGLENRLITNCDNFDLNLIDTHIDYTVVNEKLYSLRKSSLLFLKNALDK